MAAKTIPTLTSASALDTTEELHLVQGGNSRKATVAAILDAFGAYGFASQTTATPVNNGDLIIEGTNNTTVTIKLKGSDGVVRSGTITLS